MTKKQREFNKITSIAEELNKKTLEGIDLFLAETRDIEKIEMNEVEQFEISQELNMALEEYGWR